MLFIKLEVPNIRTHELNAILNQITLEANLDAMEETFDQVWRRVAAYHLRLT